MSYTLRPTESDDGNDFVFEHEGYACGRCYITTIASGQMVWHWTVYNTSLRGNAATFESAQQQFKDAYEGSAEFGKAMPFFTD